MNDGETTVRRATTEDARAIAPLFDAYRQFYEQPSDLALAESFIGDRLARGESVLFVAEGVGNDGLLGFVQVYPTFSSVRCGVLWVLNDLYVAEGARRGGVGERLMNAVSDAARAAGARAVTLTTAHDNARARRLYERLGYEHDTEFRAYWLELGPSR